VRRLALAEDRRIGARAADPAFFHRSSPDEAAVTRKLPAPAPGANSSKRWFARRNTYDLKLGIRAEEKLWHVELENGRTVCGLKLELRGGSLAHHFADEPPGKLCENCNRMKDADTVRPNLRK
jgi:hypothetical protein